MTWRRSLHMHPILYKDEVQAGTADSVELATELVNAANWIGDFRAALQDCAVDETNPDTCGVCGLHFADCDTDHRHVGDPDGPLEPACAGARARVLIKKGSPS
jgi:hypothetical protein